MASLLPIPTPQSLFIRRHYSGYKRGPPSLVKSPAKLIALCCPSTSVVEDPSLPALDGVPMGAESAIEDENYLTPRGCETCGREELEKGCNGEGRIQGGIATVPGFGWWPIKAFRPCPGFVASGGRYRRRGQSMDEVAFGRGRREAPMGSTDEVPSSKKKQSPGRFKREILQ